MTTEDQSESDAAALRRILGEIFPVEHVDPGMLTFRFADGTRMSYLTGPSGRLNGVVIQRDDVPPLRLDAQQPPPRPQARAELAEGVMVAPWDEQTRGRFYVYVTKEAATCTVCGENVLPTLHVDTGVKNAQPVEVCMGCLQAVLLAQADHTSS